MLKIVTTALTVHHQKVEEKSEEHKCWEKTSARFGAISQKNPPNNSYIGDEQAQHVLLGVHARLRALECDGAGQVQHMVADVLGLGSLLHFIQYPTV